MKSSLLTRIRFLLRILYRPMPEGIEVKRLCKEVLTKLKVNSELTGSGQQIIEVPKLETGDEPPPLLLTDELPWYVL